MRPFLTLLAQDGRIPEAVLAPYRAVDPDERVPTSAAHTLLAAAQTLTDDAALGVRASLCVEPGDLGVIDYAMSTATTLEASLRTQLRFSRLMNEALDVSLHVEHTLATVRLESRVMQPQVVAEFQICAFLWQRGRVWPAEPASDLDVYLPFDAPSDHTLYARAFGPARLHFRAPWTGFQLAARHLALAMPNPDGKLHEILTRQGERVLAELPSVETVTMLVRKMLLRELSSGNPSAELAARELKMSASTLARRLAAEGTTFSDVLDELRKSLALHHVARTDLGFDEVALLAGFSNPAAFYRAFRRWTGGTPLHYRRVQRQLGPLG